MISIDNIEEYRIEFNSSHKSLFLEEGEQETKQEHQDQIIPLDSEASDFLWRYEGINFPCSMNPPLTKYFKEVEKWYSGSASDEQIKKWLYNRGIPFGQKVFLSVQPYWGYVLTWKMIIKYSAMIFSGSDQTVFDRTLNWWLTYHHDGDFHFCKHRMYGPKQGYQDWEKDQRTIQEFKNTAKLTEGRQKFSQNPYLRNK